MHKDVVVGPVHVLRSNMPKGRRNESSAASDISRIINQEGPQIKKYNFSSQFPEDCEPRIKCSRYLFNPLCGFCTIYVINLELNQDSMLG